MFGHSRGGEGEESQRESSNSIIFQRESVLMMSKVDKCQPQRQRPTNSPLPPLAGPNRVFHVSGIVQPSQESQMVSSVVKVSICHRFLFSLPNYGNMAVFLTPVRVLEEPRSRENQMITERDKSMQRRLHPAIHDVCRRSCVDKSKLTCV